MGFWDWFLGNEESGATAEPTTPAPPTQEDIQAALTDMEALVTGGRVPAPVRSRVLRVTSAVRKTLPRLEFLGLGSYDAYSVIATATDYLPQAVGAYLRLPRDWADTRPIENGKSSLMLLIDQLDLLGATMDKIYDAANSTDAAALIANGRFLQEKFGHPSVPSQLTPPSKPSVTSSNPLDV